MALYSFSIDMVVGKKCSMLVYFDYYNNVNNCRNAEINKHRGVKYILVKVK